MKILNINTFDNRGGAARASLRLHKALQKSEIASHFLVQRKSCTDTSVIGAEDLFEEKISKYRSLLDSIPVRFYSNRSPILFSSSWLPSQRQIKRIVRFNPDIIHLHWINGGFFKIEDLAKIQKPIVWTLHDNWPFTGGCHIKWDCNKYKQKCGSCPVLGSNREYDLSRIIWNRKKKTYSKIKNLTIVGLSRWISDCAKNSPLFSSRRVVTIPNTIDTKEFKPLEKQHVRQKLGIPKDKFVILFGAHNAITDLNKGFEEFCNAVNSIGRSEIEILVFGNKEQNQPKHLKFKTHYVGIVESDEKLIELYSAADVMVVPSRQEAFGQTAMEAMACGVPVVAYAQTGLLDIVDHKVNGYLAKMSHLDDLTKGIEWVLDHSDRLDMSKKTIKKIEDCFSEEIVVNKYISLYREIIARN